MIIQGQITLPTGVIINGGDLLAGVTTFLNNLRSKLGITVSGFVNDALENASFGTVQTGIGVVRNVNLDMQPVDTLDIRATNLLDYASPRLGQETLTVDTFNKLKITLNETMARQSVPDMAIDSLLGVARTMLETTRSFNAFKEVIIDSCLRPYLQNSNAPRVFVPLVPQGTTPVDINQSNELNARTIIKYIREYATDMEIPSNNYTLNKTYVLEGTTYNIKQNVSAESLRLWVNSKYDTLITADALAPIFNEGTLNGMISRHRKVVVPQSYLSSGGVNTNYVNGDIIGILGSEDLFAYVVHYLFAASFYDPNTLNTHYFLHEARGAGIFKTAPGVILVAQVGSTQPGLPSIPDVPVEPVVAQVGTTQPGLPSIPEVPVEPVVVP